MNSISLYFFLVIQNDTISCLLLLFLIELIVIGRHDFFSMSTILHSLLTPLYVPASTVSVSYFILAVPMRKWLRKHACTSSPFPIAILNGTCFFPTV